MDDLIGLNARAVANYVFLFSDIENSTQRWREFPKEMGAVLARHDVLLRDVVGIAGGVVFKTTGDGGHAVFATVADALAAAAALARRVKAEDFIGVGGIKLRVGVHCGPAEFRDGDYFGLTLSRTARIMAAGHGGQVLVSAAAAESSGTGIVLRSLGVRRLKDLGQAEEIFQLAGPELEAEFPPLRALDARPNNLPLQTSGFIGREAELADLRGLLAQHRLVTVLGPGGIGKTRLALQAAADALDDYTDGVFVVELASVTQGEQVAAAAAFALNITLGAGGGQAEQLASALRGAVTLIVLDNCEHLIEAASALAEAILRRNAGVKILATSRSPLSLSGEQNFALPTFAVPAAASLSSISAEAAAGYAGIQLFVERAALVQLGFALDAGNAADIAAICQRLDGIALAIELAAARIRLLRPKDLLARLDDRFRLLTGGVRTHLPRQQTLKGLIDWSYDLLTEAERVTFRRLGVFAGSFDLASADAVLRGGPIDTLDVLDLVASLLDKSLVTRLSAQDRAPRYRLLESTRHYAMEKLAQAGETAALNQAHARHMVTRFREARRRYWDTDTLVWRADVEAEIENFQAALAWAFGGDGDDGIAVALAACLRPLQEQALIPLASFQVYSQAVVTKLAPDTPQDDAAWLWQTLSSSDTTAGAGPQAAAAETARTLFENLHDRQRAGQSAALGAFALIRAGDPAAAQRAADAARAILPASAPDLNTAETLFNLAIYQAIAARDAADIAAAHRDYTAALAIYEKFNNEAGMLVVSLYLADERAMLGDYAGAIERGERNLAQNRARRNWRQTQDLINLTSYHLLAGDVSAARRTAEDALPMAAELENKTFGAAFSGSLALLAARGGALETAATLAGYTERCYISHQETMQPIEQRVWDVLIALFAAAETTGALPAQARARLMQQGEALSLREVLKLASFLPSTGFTGSFPHGSEPDHTSRS